MDSAVFVESLSMDSAVFVDSLSVDSAVFIDSLSAWENCNDRFLYAFMKTTLKSKIVMIHI